MKSVLATACVLCAVSLPAAAQTAGAQGASAQNASGQQAPANINFMRSRDANTWRASDLIGKDVYGARDEDIGEVGDVLIDRNGQVKGVVLDVGGFLGVGETEVAVPMQALQFRKEENSAATNGADPRTGPSATTGAGNVTSPRGNTTAAGNARGVAPDRIILLVTSDQLRAAPKFEDDNRPNRSSSRTGQGTAAGSTPATSSKTSAGAEPSRPAAGQGNTSGASSTK